ncbi:MAG TPA: aldehyde dehydrogenase family protein, partial [Ilumatobacteraceae bacterium]|nr:aldehyde dehydrogenase family protein [Ilumatobacteraceae bacterium]
QDRAADVVAMPLDRFANAADTDWTRVSNRDWLATAMSQTGISEVRQIDSISEIDAAVERARAAAATWSSTSFAERRRVLADVAAEMERSRGRTLALMAHTACKTVAEGDPEVSEAVDFARYYGWCTHAIEDRVGRARRFEPHGVVVVASPWNFPYAIPAGGVLAALAAGNAVILKPAPEVREVAQEIVAQLWRAGVPRDVVQFVPAGDNDAGRRLVTHEHVDAVVLTGSYETAQMFRSWKPSLRLMAETSGKNALVVTAAADEDAAIRDLVKSAFGHAGQKCSAASLAIVEASLYDDGKFLHRLAEAVRSVRVGPATDPASMMGPVVGTPSDKLRRALTTLDEGEQWLVEPTCVDSGRNLWTPGVRIGVRRGSWFHQTEAFGPVLGVMRADDVDDAIAMQNDVAYGLTGGIHSLDEHEVERWLEQVEVGNAYVNRHTTGAVVQRQPFGGWKRSSVGGAPKAGGPFYVEAFGTWSGGGDGDAEFRRVWNEWFCVDHDPSGLAAEHNVLRYRPLPSVGLFVGDDATADAVEIANLAQSVVGRPPVHVVAGMTQRVDRVRVVGSVSDEQLRDWYRAGIDVDRVQPVADAMVELRRWVREQAISTTRHRHGRLLD